jgi:glycosyltransferase involved in cell wall biosynthesis
LIKELANRHQICVLSFLEPDQDPDDSGPLPEWCHWIETLPVPERTTGTRLRQLVTTRRPDMSWRLWSPAFDDRLARRLQEQPFDVVSIEGIEMAPYLPTIEQAQPKPLVIYDAHNAEWILQKRAFATDIMTPSRWLVAAYSWVQWHRLLRYEADLMERAAHTVAMSHPDKVALREINPNVPTSVVPNGVDVLAYSHFKGESISSDIVFTGKMDFRPNIDAVLWFCRQVLPLIQARRPGTTFAAVGRQPHDRLDVLRDRPGVTITGYVADIRPYIAGAMVYAVPLRMGGGTRLKVLEAMAMGKAIVSTSLGAEGFPVVSGKELVLADDPEQFAREVLNLRENPLRRARLGRVGKSFALANYSWDVLVPRLEQLYKASLVQKK